VHPTALLHDMRRLVSHQVQVMLRGPWPQPDIMAVGEGAGIEGSSGFPVSAVVVDAHVTEVCA
jgi:hypothetical protein